jgi:D-amino-acid oxidase
VIQPHLEALVIGCGVSGLTTAVCLSEAGIPVHIWTEAMPAATTSAAAGAQWGPYMVEPWARVREWSRRTLEVLRDLAQSPGTGVSDVEGVEASRQLAPEPPWADLLPGLRRCDREELPPGFFDGWRSRVPLVDMPIYLDYLLDRFRSGGGQVSVRPVKSLSEAARQASVVVNCSGVDARALVPDDGVTPIRGQLVVIENPGIEEFFSEDTGPSPDLTYICPHGDSVVLGGTAHDGAWNLEPDPATAEAILRRCAEVEPRVMGSRVIDHRVGLRPTRASVRVDEEMLPDGTMILHNYGHGGAGVTLSWGCAQEIVTRVGSGATT